MEKKLKRNRIKCKHCNEIIESFHTYDFKYCSCKKVAIDGGLEYAKRILPSGADSNNYIEDLSEWET